ncbi:MAG TPA: glycosyltransferase family 9 protein [Capsulimonadaceae bacterium]|jgi:heptosyltransferase-2
MKDIRTILVTTKYRYIGDTLLAVPTLRAIRSTWPNARVILLTGNSAAELMRNCPYVNEIIAFNPECPDNRGLNLYRNLVPRLRREKIDLSFVYHSSFHAALTPWLAGAKRRIGWAGFEGRDFLFSQSYPYTEDCSELECDLQLVRNVAPNAVTDSLLELWLTPDELNDVPANLVGGDRIVGIQPGATNDGKRWPAEHFAALAEMLIGKGLADRIAIIGGQDEIDARREFVSATSSRIAGTLIDLTGRLTLRQSLASLKRLTFFVGNDTAIRHCTVALDVPSIGLFGPTNSVKWGNCNPPRQQIIVSPTRIMADISPEDVFDKVSAIFETHSEQAPTCFAATGSQDSEDRKRSKVRGLDRAQTEPSSATQGSSETLVQTSDATVDAVSLKSFAA